MVKEGASPPRAGVIGWPIAHSRSPLIHGTWLKRHGLAGRYERIAVAPDEADAFFADFAGKGLVGANVTIPHKQTAARHCDRLSDVAATLGAVNTLWLEEGRLCGDNTDVAGFLGHLDASQPGWENRVNRAVVLGAGGASLAVLYGLKSRGLGDVLVLNRSADKARSVADRFGYESASLESASEALEGADLLVNTTALGMAGQPPLDLDPAPMAPGGIVYDIVYVPLETALLRRARAAGLHAVDGLGMLLHQAVPGFARWFGVKPCVDESLRNSLLADLGETENRAGATSSGQEPPA
ncbi:MAG: shikimate dehydrogenase [Hyphomicrobiaceae bacterium]|nr:shikimate dehydrogenase [Hyphomicrobiaceae bacterium]